MNFTTGLSIDDVKCFLEPSFSHVSLPSVSHLSSDERSPVRKVKELSPCSRALCIRWPDPPPPPPRRACPARARRLPRPPPARTPRGWGRAIPPAIMWLGWLPPANLTTEVASGSPRNGLLDPVPLSARALPYEANEGNVVLTSPGAAIADPSNCA